MAGVEISKKLVFLNSASSAIRLGLNLSVLVWLQQYLIKRISPEEYSLLPVVMAVMAFAPIVSTILAGGIGQFVTVAYAKGDEWQVTRVCSTMLPILIGASLVMVLMGGGLVWQLDNVLNVAPARLSDFRIMLGMLIFTTALRLPVSILGAGFIVRQKLVLHDAIIIACQVLKYIILFSLLLGVSTRVIWVVTATVAAELVQLAIETVISLRLIPAQRFQRKAVHWPLAKEVVSYGSWSMADEMARTAKDAMDPLMLNRFASAISVASFHVAGIAPRQLVMILGPIARPFIPVLAAFHATGEWERMRRTYLRIARYQVWILVTIAVPTGIFADEIMGLYLDNKYPIAGSIMSVLVVVPIFGSFNALGPAVAFAKGEVKGISLRHLVVQIFNLSLTFAFVGYMGWGALGCAVATLVTCATVDILLTWRFCWRITRTTFRQWLSEVFVPTILPAVPSLLFCFYLKEVVVLDSWFQLFGFSAISAALYLAFVFSLALREQDKIDLVRLSYRTPPKIAVFLRFVGRAKSMDPALVLELSKK